MKNNSLNRRKFLKKSSGTALGTLGISNTLLNLKLLQNATAMPAGSGDYRALVCVFLEGGNDSYNTLVPLGSEYANYAAQRGSLALPASGRGSALPLNVRNTPGRAFGIHPSMPGLRGLFNDGDAAFIANVGSLIEPTSIAQFQNRSQQRPIGLFAHNIQRSVWQTSLAQEREHPTGWAGRLADRVKANNTSNEISMNISLSGNPLVLRGSDISSYAIGEDGAARIAGISSSNMFNRLRANRTQSLWENEHRNLLMDAFGTESSSSFENAEFFAESFNSTVVNTTIGGSIGGELEAIARTIAARGVLGQRRQIFFVNIGGWDTHSLQDTNHPSLLSRLDASLTGFWQAIQELGVEDRVTLFNATDFGRTLRSNGSGSDHAWGGNVFAVGGAVRGGRIYGDYPDPDELRVGSGLDVGSNGRLLPTTSIDEYFAELALWFGLPRGELNEVFPNLRNFGNFSATNPPLGFLL